MIKEVERDTNLVLARAQKATVWIPWYFKRGVFAFLTVPFFLVVVLSLVTSIIGAVFQEIGILRVSRAVFGFKGLFVAILFGWTPVILPPDPLR